MVNEIITDGSANLWINANAGSGKTTALINRVISLMLSGSKIDSILIITYTENGIAEIKERINRKIFYLSSLSGDELKKEVKSIVGDGYNERMLKIASSIDVQLLNRQEAYSILTLHSFCNKIIYSYSKENNIPAPVRIDETPHEKKRLERLKKVVEDEIERMLSADNEYLSAIVGPIVELIEKNNVGSLDRIIDNLIKNNLNKSENEIVISGEMLHEINDSLEEAENEMYSLLLNGDGNKVLEVLRSSKNKSGSTCASKLNDILQDHLEWKSVKKIDKSMYFKSVIKKVEDIFINKSGDIIKEKNLGAVDKNNAGREFYECWLKDIVGSVIKIEYNKNTKMAILLSLGLRYLQNIVNEENDKILDEYNIIDHNGSLSMTLRLINEGKKGIDNVLYELNRKTRHILIDEAQDINPVLWNIVFSAFETFFEDNGKTFFVVGDEKQSIFEFQGANVKNLIKIKGRLRDLLKNAGKELKEIELNYSYRTDQKILDVVDCVFNSDDNVKSVSSSESIKHISKVNGLSGVVEVHSVDQKKTRITKSEGWKLPYKNNNEEEEESDQEVIKVQEIIINEIQKGTARSQIMVLVANRKEGLFDLIHRLRKSGVKCNIDKTVISRNIVFRDFITLLKFLVYPHNNYNFIALLRSVFFDLDLETIKGVCFSHKDNNDSKFIYDTISSFDNKIYMRAKKMRDDYRENGIEALLGRLLFGEGIMEKIETRYSMSSVNIVYYVLEKISTGMKNGSMDEIIENFTNGKMNIDVRFEDEVQIRTIHSSKGSESEVVILWDINKKQSNDIWDKGTNIIMPRKTKHIDERIKTIIQNNIKDEKNERQRLLYVAMTRAKNKLHVIGNKDRENSWTYQIESGIKNSKT
ncbi:UvrD-helicase domain-containing protein [Rickettsiales bacterium]|nr:UvrD-helicase domain-containing protein [Rickettsiales bacterium]